MLTALNSAVKAPMRGENWPTSAHVLTRQLKSMSTSLVDVGLVVELNIRQTRLGHVIRVTKGK
jgi:hypothetical protein